MDVDLDAHRTLGREAAGGVPDKERAGLHIVVTRFEVVVGLDDDRPALTDANDDIVAPGEFDAVERGDVAGLRRGDADPSLLELDELPNTSN